MLVNPIVASGADPWVISWRDRYYYCGATPENDIFIRVSDKLSDIGRADARKAWSPPPTKAYSEHVWAPELHLLSRRWYVYFAADDGDNRNHRMYVLRGLSQDPLGPYEFVGRIATPEDRWAIDGTVLVLPGWGMYFIWSGWEEDEDIAQNLYIAPMSDPTRVAGARSCISTPEYPWETVGTPLVNEGPQPLWNGQRLFLIYSASGSWTDAYCLGQLTYLGGDPCRPNSWAKKPEPVFAPTDEVFGPGHASFVTSQGRDWIVYHAAKYRGAGWDRDIRAQPFDWNQDGSPFFGTPVSSGVPVG